MAHEKAKGQQAEKLFLGSLRASRAIKKQFAMTDPVVGGILLKSVWELFNVLVALGHSRTT